MSKKIKPTKFLNKPKDRSYEAYVEFLLSTAKALGKTITTYDEDRMRARWKDYWAS